MYELRNSLSFNQSCYSWSREDRYDDIENTDKRIQHRRHPTNKHETKKFKQRLAKI